MVGHHTGSDTPDFLPNSLVCTAGRQGGGVGTATPCLQAGRAAGGQHAGHVDAASHDAAGERLVRSIKLTTKASQYPDHNVVVLNDSTGQALYRVTASFSLCLCTELAPAWDIYGDEGLHFAD